MAEKKTGAGAHLAGVLERPTPPRPVTTVAPQTPDIDAADTTADEGGEPANGRGRGASRKGNVAARLAKKIKGRTIYLPDDLFERIMVQAHRREMTISDYCAMMLGRHVPDHQARGRGDGDGAAT